MNSFSGHINKKQKEYYGAIGDDMDINPISKSDTNIIKELCELLKKTGCTEATVIMNDFKRLPDFQIEEMLVDLNTQKGNPIEGIGEGQEEEKQKNIEFNDLRKSRYKLRDIYMYYQHEEEGYPCIYLNETPPQATKLPVVSDVILKYRSEAERDADLFILDQLF